MSLVMNVDDLFGNGPSGTNGIKGIYTNPTAVDANSATTKLWERAASLELMNPEGGGGFQINALAHIHGGGSRYAYKTPKHSFTISFDDPNDGNLNYPLFGPDAASNFDTLVLNARYNNTWLHMDGTQRGHGTYIQDQWNVDTQLAMGDLARHETYVNLYINGLYWGVYNASEMPGASFAASYLGGNKDDYDAIKMSDNGGLHAADGNMTAWNTMFSMAQAGLGSDAAYQAFGKFLDIPDFVQLHDPEILRIGWRLGPAQLGRNPPVAARWRGQRQHGRLQVRELGQRADAGGRERLQLGNGQLRHAQLCSQLSLPETPGQRPVPAALGGSRSQILLQQRCADAVGGRVALQAGDGQGGQRAGGRISAMGRLSARRFRELPGHHALHAGEHRPPRGQPAPDAIFPVPDGHGAADVQEQQPLPQRRCAGAQPVRRRGRNGIPADPDQPERRDPLLHAEWHRSAAVAERHADAVALGADLRRPRHAQRQPPPHRARPEERRLERADRDAVLLRCPSGAADYGGDVPSAQTNRQRLQDRRFPVHRVSEYRRQRWIPPASWFAASATSYSPPCHRLCAPGSAW